MNENELRAELSRLPKALLDRLSRSGFDAERLIRLAAPLQHRAHGESAVRARERNRVAGRVDPPRPEDIETAPDASTAEGSRLAAVGRQAIARGELAVCVMAGGMATRMGGVVKALVEALDGQSFLRLRLNENRAWSAGATAPVPLWLMTSEATDAPIRAALVELGAGPHVRTFTQDLGLRLTPDGALFRDGDGMPSTYAPGHGDLPDALRRSGLLTSFVERGGKYVWIENIDNLGATIDPAILGSFIEHPADLLVEVTAKEQGDRGGIPVWTTTTDEAGQPLRRLQVLEAFRLPDGFDAASVRVFNTNTFLVRAEALLRAHPAWSWFEVEKKVGDHVAVQFERLLQELTAAMPARYLRVPRDGAASRFIPVKDHDELARRRDQIRAVAASRRLDG